MKITKDPWIWWGREANRPLSLSQWNGDFCPCSLTRYAKGKMLRFDAVRLRLTAFVSITQDRVEVGKVHVYV
ncbi:hypothetical protein J3E68DRAFT_396645 [Trichoderma sp. SZMC 28012]